MSLTSEQMKLHWDQVYSKMEATNLGWYEENPIPSIQLIEQCGLSINDRILNVGAGTTTLINLLLDRGFYHQTYTDISEVALNKMKAELGTPKSNLIRWIRDDLTQPDALLNIGSVDLWHDRAVLHFFLEKEQRKQYFSLLDTLVKPGGFVIIAVFALEGATICSGLPIFRYDEQMLADHLGHAYQLMDSFPYEYIMPSGDIRNYIYTLFNKTE